MGHFNVVVIKFEFKTYIACVQTCHYMVPLKGNNQNSAVMETNLYLKKILNYIGVNNIEIKFYILTIYFKLLKTVKMSPKI